MLQLSIILFCTALLSLTSGAPINDTQPQTAYPKALYFNVNHVPNSVASVKVNPDGTLSDGLITATGGNGASANQGKINVPAAPDALLGTGPIIVVKDVCTLRPRRFARI